MVSVFWRSFLTARELQAAPWRLVTLMQDLLSHGPNPYFLYKRALLHDSMLLLPYSLTNLGFFPSRSVIQLCVCRGGLEMGQSFLILSGKQFHRVGSVHLLTVAISMHVKISRVLNVQLWQRLWQSMPAFCLTEIPTFLPYTPQRVFCSQDQWLLVVPGPKGFH